MKADHDTPTLDDLLGHAAWVRGLARTLVRDADLADDLVQEAWLAALRRPPSHGQNLKGWLGTLVRRLAARSHERSSGGREREASVAREEALPSTDELVARASKQREVVAEVLDLEPHYRDVVLLRHFEDLAPRQIAELLGVPVATVHTRLQRAHDRLRGALERRYGERGQWCLALAPLVRPTAAELLAGPAAGGPTGLEASTGSTSPLGFPLTLALTMKLSLIVIGTVATAVSGAFLLGWGDTPATAVADAPAVQVEAAPESVSRLADSPPPVARRVVASASARTGSATPDAADSAVEPLADVGVLRLVDADLRPLVGLRLRLDDGGLVRWAGGDPIWIQGGGETLQVSLDDQRRLREDSGFAERFLAERDRPEEWRSALFGTPVPERELRSGAEGRLPFDLAAALGGVKLVDLEWALLALAREPESDDSPSWVVAAPATQLSGRVLDTDGEPIRRARVRLAPGAAEALEAAGRLEVVQLVEPAEIYSMGDGGFALRDVPAVPGLEFEVSAEGFAAQRLAVPTSDDHELSIVLEPADRTAVRFEGQVLALGAGPAAGATVFLGVNRTTTDAEGRFTFALDDVDPAATLAVVHPPFEALCEPGFGRTLLADPVGNGLRTLVLERSARTLRGRVVDADGSPLAGLSLNLFDPQLPDTTFSTLEALAGARGRMVTTGDDGRFDLGGLAARAYRLRLFDRDRALFHVTEPVAADAEFVELTVPNEARREVRGRVLDAEGRGQAGARVAVVFETFVNRSGLGTINEICEPVVADDEGRFVLPSVPLAEARIGFELAGGDQASVPVEFVDAAGELMLVHPAPTALSIAVPGARAGDRIAVLGLAGSRVELTTWGALPGEGSLGTSVEAGPAVRVAAPVGAREVVLLRDGAVAARAAVPDCGGRIVRLRLGS